MVLLVELGKESFEKWWTYEYDIPLHHLDVPVHVLHANEMPSRDLKHGLH